MNISYHVALPDPSNTICAVGSTYALIFCLFLSLRHEFYLAIPRHSTPARRLLSEAVFFVNYRHLCCIITDDKCLIFPSKMKCICIHAIYTLWEVNLPRTSLGWITNLGTCSDIANLGVTVRPTINMSVCRKPPFE